MSRSTNTDQPEIISGLATLSITSYSPDNKLFSCVWHKTDKSTIDAIGGTIVVSQDPYIMANIDVGDGVVLQTKITSSGRDSQGNDVYISRKHRRWGPANNEKVIVARSEDGFPQGLVFEPGASKFVEDREQPYPCDAAYTAFKSNETVIMTISEQQVSGVEIWVKSDAPLPENELVTTDVKLYGTVQAGTL